MSPCNPEHDNVVNVEKPNSDICNIVINHKYYVRCLSEINNDGV